MKGLVVSGEEGKRCLSPLFLFYLMNIRGKRMMGRPYSGAKLDRGETN